MSRCHQAQAVLTAHVGCLTRRLRHYNMVVRICVLTFFHQDADFLEEGINCFARFKFYGTKFVSGEPKYFLVLHNLQILSSMCWVSSSRRPIVSTCRPVLSLRGLTRSVGNLGKYSRKRFLNFPRACGASEEDQSTWGIGNPANSAMFIVFGVDEKCGCSPAWCSNLSWKSQI